MIPPGYTLLKTAHANIARETSDREAWGILRYLLVTGDVIASAFVDKDSEVKETPEFWGGLSREAWEAIIASDGMHYGLDPEDYPDDPGELERELIALSHPGMLVVRRGELQAALDNYNIFSTNIEEIDKKSSSKGGNKPKYKYLKFAQIVFKLLINAHEGNYPDFNAFLKRATDDFSKEYEDGIDEGTARGVAKALYDVWVKT